MEKKTLEIERLSKKRKRRVKVCKCCGYTWLPQANNLKPRVCAKCGSEYWRFGKSKYKITRDARKAQREEKGTLEILKEQYEKEMREASDRFQLKLIKRSQENMKNKEKTNGNK